MRKINNKSILVMATMICYLVLSFFFLTNINMSKYVNIINPIFWILLLIINYLLFKNEYVNKKYKYDVFLTEMITLIAFFLIYYLLGMYVGVSKSPYSSSLAGALINILSVATVAVSQEYIREKLINRTGRNKKSVVLITMLFIFLDLVRHFYVYNFSSGETIFRFIVEIVNPMIAKHSLLTYLVYNSGIRNSLIYRLVMDCFSFVVPYEPNLGWLLNGTINIVLPYIIYSNSNKIFEKYNNKEEYKKTIKRIYFMFLYLYRCRL